MAKLWTRVHKWIHPREWDGDKNSPRHSLEAHLQRAALARRHSQSALAPQIGTSRGEQRSGNVRRQQSRSLPNALREPNVLLTAPEHQLARSRHQYLNDALPEDLQRSRFSYNLHDLSLSDEAGQQPHCEDVAERNMRRRNVSFPTAPRANRTLHERSHVAQSSPNYTRQVPCLSSVNESGLYERSHAGDYQVFQSTHQQRRSSPHVRWECPRGTERRSKSMHAQSHVLGWQPAGTEERRHSLTHSLTHKPDIFDLRSSFGTAHLPSPVASPRRYHSEPGQSKQNSIKRSRLHMPLPPIPVTDIGEHLRQAPRTQPSRCKGQHDYQPKHPMLPPVLPSLSRTEDTTFYERWAPAVTHETITRKVHEIREEHIHKEIHNYHINRRVQPVIAYEILPARHFVCVDGVYHEMDEKDLPLGTPDADWFITEVASKLDSIKPDEIISGEGRYRDSNLGLVGRRANSQDRGSFLGRHNNQFHN